jgi:hypothetical protein
MVGFWRKKCFYFLLLTCIFLQNVGLSANSQEKDAACPQTLPKLTEKMLTDLPSYSNRVTQRSRLLREYSNTSYIILAGQPEFKPLPLENLQYQPIFPNSTQQFFFTTLERHYLNNRAVTYESYYWVFLTQEGGKWRLVKVLTALAALNADDVPLPPQDATDGIIGQGIQLWLRDCQF